MKKPTYIQLERQLDAAKAAYDELHARQSALVMENSRLGRERAEARDAHRAVLQDLASKTDQLVNLSGDVGRLRGYIERVRDLDNMEFGRRAQQVRANPIEWANAAVANGHDDHRRG